MKRYVEKEEEETTNELTNWVGVILGNDTKGAVLYTGEKYHIICNNDAGECNEVCGGEESDGNNIKDTIKRWKNQNAAVIPIKDVYCFDSYKKLMTWFVDGMED